MKIRFLYMIVVFFIAIYAFAAVPTLTGNPQANQYLEFNLGYDYAGAKEFKEIIRSMGEDSDPESAPRSVDLVNGWTVRANTIWNSFNYFKMNAQQEAAVLPTKFDLRNVNGISYVTPIRDQNWHGLCWAFGAVASLESAILWQWENFTAKYGYLVSSDSRNVFNKENLNLAEQYSSWMNYKRVQSLYAHNRKDGGGFGFFAMYNFLRYGSPIENDFPYIADGLTNAGGGTDNMGQLNIIFNPATNDWSNRMIRPDKIAYIGDPWEIAWGTVDYGSYANYVKTIKTLIQTYGALEVSYYVPTDFDGYEDFGYIYVPTNDGISVSGGHAVAVVGWDDAMPLTEFMIEYLTYFNLWEFVGIPEGSTTVPVWIVKNSWGDAWGEQGYFYMPIVSENGWTNFNIFAEEIEDNPEWWKVDRDWLHVPVFEDVENYMKADFNRDGKIDQVDFDLLAAALEIILTTEGLAPEMIELFDISLVHDNVVNYEDYFEFVNCWNKAN